MKKIIPTLAFILIASMLACASAQVLYPMNLDSVDLQEDMSYSISVNPENVTETEITFDVFIEDFFDWEQAKTLVPSDVIVAGGVECTVRTVEENANSVILINGGAGAAEDGVTLEPEGGEVLSKTGDGKIGYTNVGTITRPLADTVVFIHFYDTEDGYENIDTEMPGSEVKSFINAMGDDSSLLIDPYAMSVDIIDGKVDCIMMSHVE